MPLDITLPPPDPSPAANREALREIFSREAEWPTNGSTPALFTVPPGTYEVDDTIPLCRRFATIRGAGAFLSRIVMAPGIGSDVVAAGINPTPNGVALDPRHLPDGFGILDGAAAPTPGVRWGIRTRAEAHVAQAGGPLDQIDWPACPGILVEMIVDLGNLPAGGTASLCGIADGGPRPITLAIMGGSLQLHARTRAPDDPGSGAVRRFGGPILARRVARVALWLDVAAGKVLLWIDGNRAEINGAQGPLAAGEPLAPSDGAHFGVGGFGRTVSQAGDLYGAAADVAFYGLRIGSAMPYDPESRALRRTDGGPIDDSWQFFREGPDLLAYLPLRDRPADVARYRFVTVRGPDGYGRSVPTRAYFLDDQAHNNPFGGIAWTTFDGIGFESGSGQPFGDAIKFGGITHSRILDCDARGARRGIALFNWGAAYQLRFRDVYATGRDCPVHLANASSTTLDGLNLSNAQEYRAAVRLIDSGATIRDVVSPHAGSPEYAAYLRRSAATLQSWSLDNEEGGGSRRADVYATPVQDSGFPTPVLLEDWRVAGHGPDASAVILDGPAADARGQVGDCSLAVTRHGIADSSRLRSYVRVTEPAAGLWRDAGIHFGTSAAPGRLAIEGPGLAPSTVRHAIGQP